MDDDRRIAIPITGELDLHAFAPRDVASVAKEYVRACVKQGIVFVRLIHGRGTGVQRAVVRRTLRGMPDVVRVEDAQPESGGWGATLIELAPRKMDL